MEAVSSSRFPSLRYTKLKLTMTGSRVAQAALELIEARMTELSLLLSSLNAGRTGASHHTKFYVVLGTDPRP